MGHWGDGANRPTCHQEGCGRRYYVEGEDGLLCHVCDGALRSEWEQKMLCGSPARQSSAPLQDLFLDNPAVAKLCMEFTHGDGWQLQCHCTRCPRPWLDAGWVCPVEYQRRTHLQDLDRIFLFRGYTQGRLCYVDWVAAVRRIHDMRTDVVLWDTAALLEFAEASARRVRGELREMYPDEHLDDGLMEEGILARSALWIG